ncbi:MAG: hypothetical protein EOP87_05475 [Verrucomicrobiaceae bacterium]|nr:MAG: hypothetical protein EOP87_05475 [Verrucomicrobiaceae bacterium]
MAGYEVRRLIAERIALVLLGLGVGLMIALFCSPPGGTAFRLAAEFTLIPSYYGCRPLAMPWLAK